MSNQREDNIPDWDLEEHFRSAQQLSQRLAAVVEAEGEDAFRSTRPSTTTSFPPRSSSMPSAAQPTPLFASLRTAPAESTTWYPAVGENESLFGPFRPSISTSGPSSNTATLDQAVVIAEDATLDRAVELVENAPPGRIESDSLPGVWLMTDPPQLHRPYANQERPPADSAVRYLVPEGPASTTASLPPHLPSNSTPTGRTTCDSQPQTLSQPIEGERACCLACAKANLVCIPLQSQIKQRCLRCRHTNTACIPIPAKHLPGYLAMKQIFREGRRADGYDALNAWVDSINDTDPLVRIERQLFLLNRNVERLLNAQLSMNGKPAPRFIEEEFPEK